MPRLRAFRAVRYPQSDLSTKIAPPYDVLDEGPKRALLARDPNNIVAVDLPVTPPKTLGPESAYADAGALYRRWLAGGVLVRDDSPALYVYEQSWDGPAGPEERVRRRGLFATLGLEEFNRPNGGIFRHEETIRGGVDDRLMLMRATAAQLSPVFAVYDDAAGDARSLYEPQCDQAPIARGKTGDGVDHKLWALRDPGIVAQLARQFEATDVFIADGHHRYTTALNLHRENSGNVASDSCLFLLTAMQDTGLIVRATHRILTGLRGLTLDALRRAADEDGRITLTPDPGGDSLNRPGFAVRLHTPFGGGPWLLSARDTDPLRESHPHRPKVWRTLDVAILHELFIDRVLRKSFGGTSISCKYYGDEKEFYGACRQGGELGVFMRPTPLPSVIEVARAGCVMPPKSTFFHPKVATGFVIHPLDG